MDFQPYGKYIIIGAIALVAIALVLWLGTAVFVLRNTKGIPLAINDFFQAIADNKIDEAYSSTAEDFQRQVSKPQFQKLIKDYKFKQYQKSRLEIPQMQTAKNSILDATLILKSGREIPLQFALVRENKVWQIAGLRMV